jgi:hypothetical protein
MGPSNGPGFSSQAAAARPAAASPTTGKTFRDRIFRKGGGGAAGRAPEAPPSVGAVSVPCPALMASLLPGRVGGTRWTTTGPPGVLKHNGTRAESPRPALHPLTHAAGSGYRVGGWRCLPIQPCPPEPQPAAGQPHRPAAPPASDGRRRLLARGSVSWWRPPSPITQLKRWWPSAPEPSPRPERCWRSARLGGRGALRSGRGLQFAGPDPSREPKALRFIAFSFFGLAAFVTFDAVRALAGGSEAQHSPVGIALAAASLAVMPFLSLAQRRAGREFVSRSAVADSKQTLLCTTSPRSCSAGCCSTPRWGGPGPIRLPR